MLLESRADRVARRNGHRAQWTAVKHVIVFYVCYVCTLLPLVWGHSEFATQLEGIVAGLDLALIVTFVGITRTRLRTILRPDAAAIQFTAVALAALPVLLAINFLYHGLLAQSLDVETEGTVSSYVDRDLAPWVAVIFICLLPAILEEVAFRGIIHSQLTRAIGTREAIVLGAALFAIIHVSVFSGIYLFGLGLVLGWLRHRSGSLIPCMVLHFFHNFAVVAVSYHELWTAA